MNRLVLLCVFTFFITCTIQAFQPPERDSIIEDFEEMSLASGMDGDGNNIGFITFGSPSEANSIGLTKMPPVPISMTDPMNQVLCDTFFDSSSFAGFVRIFTNEAVDAWQPMDWSTYEGLRLWIYGNNTGVNLFLDILDNRFPGSTTDDAERWTLSLIDDFNGWRFFEFSWEDFSRKDIGNGAPNDGFNLTEINGYAFGNFGNTLTNAYYLDSVAVWGTRVLPEIPVTVQFATNEYEVIEGETAQIEVDLNRVSIDPVTIMYATAESSAIPDRDFVPASGMLTIPAGSLSATFPVITIDNTKPDGDRSVMINLFDANGAEIGSIQKTRLTILDDDPEDPMLIDDFEGSHPFQSDGTVGISTKELAEGSRNALLCQGAYEYVASTSGDGTLLRTFVEPQDWTAATGLSFWFNGNGSGEEIKIVIKDNRSITTATTPSGDWVEVWSDEFDDPVGTPPNPDIWTNDIGDGSLNGTLGWGNAERQFYTDDPVNAATDGNGNMVITMQELDPATTDLICWYGPCEYTSARLNTKDKIAFEYGRIETSIKVPPGEDGLWPAFWSLGTDIDEVGWPQAGEIDIMEYVSRFPNEIFGTVHGPGYSGGSSFGAIYDFGAPVADNYHNYAIEWGPDNIKWFVDGMNYHNATPADVPGPWVFNHPFFLLLNMAIGGNFGGGISESLDFPQEMKIDYVRVYQAPETAECFEATFTDNKKGWQLVYLPFTEFTRSGDQPNGAPDDGLGLNEVWGYSITQPDIGELLFDQVRLSDGKPELPCPAIPTISEWGLILLMLLFLIMGLVVVRRKNLKIA